MSGQTEIQWGEVVAESVEMNDWKEDTLGNLVDFSSGGTPSKANNGYWNGNIPWISARTMTWHKVSVSDLNITAEALGNGSRLAPVNDILLLVRGSGLFNDIPICWVEKPVAFNQDIKAIRAKNELNQEFIYYWLHSSKKELYDILEETGIGAGKFDTELLKKLPISLPINRNEMRAVVSTAKSIFDKIDLLHRQNATLEALAETLFRQWFVEEAKEEWEEKKLGEVTSIGIGRTPPRKEHHWFSTSPADIKWVSIKDMGQVGAYIFNTSEYLTDQAVEQFKVPVIPKDTVMLSFKMTVGRVAITTEAMLSNEAIAHFKFNKKTPFTKEYLYLYLKTFKYETLGSTSSIVTSINSAMIKEMKILIPDEEMMEVFQAATESYFNKIRHNQIQIQTLSTLRDTLLPKLMSGEVRVAY